MPAPNPTGIRLTDADKAIIGTKAKAYGLDATSFIRLAVRTLPDEPFLTAEHMKTIGGTPEQISLAHTLLNDAQKKLISILHEDESSVPGIARQIEQTNNYFLSLAKDRVR